MCVCLLDGVKKGVFGILIACVAQVMNNILPYIHVIELVVPLNNGHLLKLASFPASIA